MTNGRRIATVMVNYRTPALALDALWALAGERAGEPSLRAILVDGGSGDGSAEKLTEALKDPALSDWVELLALPINGGFGWANNQAILRLLQGNDPPDYIHLLNPDTRIEPGALSTLADVLDAHRRCAAVGSLLIGHDGTPTGSAFGFPSVLREISGGARLGIIKRLLAPEQLIFYGEKACEVEWATGASVMMRSEALREVGLFDTGFFLYFEETELMWRMGVAGWSIRHEPASRVAHVGGAATGVNGASNDNLHPALPPYWFAARRRFFGLTGTRARAAAALIGWLIAHGLFMIRRKLGSGRHHPIVEREARATIAYGILPDARDRTPAITRWTDAPDQPPAWMA